MGNRILYIVLTTCLLFGSCLTKKKLIRTNQNVSDSLSMDVSITQVSDDIYYSLTTTKDTAIKIPQRSLLDTAGPESLKPVYDESGNALPNKRIIQGKGLSVTTTALPSGQLVIEGRCDSLEFLLAGQIELKEYWKQQYLNSVHNGKDYKSSSVIVEESEKVGTSIPWWVWGVLVLAFLIIVAKFIIGFKIW